MTTVRDAKRVFVGDGSEFTGKFTWEDGRITGQGDHAATPRDGLWGKEAFISAPDTVITPGLVNAHHHLLQSAFRTLPGTRHVPMRDWLGVMAAAYAKRGIDPELAYLAARVGIAESLLNGVTTVADHHLTWPEGCDSVGIAKAVAQAARELGIRLVFVRGSARDDPGTAAQSAADIIEALVPSAATKPSTARTTTPGGISADGMVQVALGPAGVHSDSEETFRRMAEVAATYGVRRRTQANEQVDVEIAAERYGKRPLQLLEEWGWLAPDVTLAHLCGVTAQEIETLAQAGVTATHAPGCDLPMGWGVAPVGELLAAGITVGLGTSGGGSNDAGHLLADARLAMQVAPLAGASITARDALQMATQGSALGLGRRDIGTLAPGAYADFCVWDTSGVHDAGVADPVAGLLWASPGRRPRDVYVGGKAVVKDGKLVNADEHQIVAALVERLGD